MLRNWEGTVRSGLYDLLLLVECLSEFYKIPTEKESKDNIHHENRPSRALRPYAYLRPRAHYNISAR
jgi:hypothetical protein